VNHSIKQYTYRFSFEAHVRPVRVSELSADCAHSCREKRGYDRKQPSPEFWPSFPQAREPACSAMKYWNTWIDVDPHASRVIRYLRLSDYAVLLSVTGVFPTALYLWGLRPAWSWPLILSFVQMWQTPLKLRWDLRCVLEVYSALLGVSWWHASARAACTSSFNFGFSFLCYH